MFRCHLDCSKFQCGLEQEGGVVVQGMPLRFWGNVKSKEGSGNHHGGYLKEATLFCIKLYCLYCYSGMVA